MHWIFARRSTAVHATLATLCLCVTAWQIVEHQRLANASRQALVDRGRDITSTLGVVVKSQRRFGVVIQKDRLVGALQDLIRPGDLEHLSILSSAGESVASAGREVDYSKELLKEQGAHWQADSVTLLNLMDLGQNISEEHPGSRAPAAIVVPDERSARALSSRRPPPQQSPSQPQTEAQANQKPKPQPEVAQAGGASAKASLGRPMWMSQQDYEAILQKQGVHSLVISLSTEQMRRQVNNDLLLRSLVCLLTLLATLAAVAAWRGLARYAELQIKLVKAVEANAHLKEMNLAAAGLAHETRNPLNLIRGLAQMISKQPEAAPKLREQADSIMEEADRVTVQLNEFINYSKPRETHPTAVEPGGIVADLTRTLSVDTEEKGIGVEIAVAPLRIEADEPLLRQALFNLLLNAVQSVGQGGHIWIDLAQAGPREAVLEIRDDGPGVPAAHREEIFKPYMTLRPKGVGLGLAIVQQIVAAHGWRIVCVENDPRGALFRISGIRVAG
jgi:signal transduction histidine kinase